MSRPNFILISNQSVHREHIGVLARLKYFMLEYFGLTIFVSPIEKSYERVKIMRFLRTILKKLPMIVLKLFIVFESD